MVIADYLLAMPFFCMLNIMMGPAPHSFPSNFCLSISYTSVELTCQFISPKKLSPQHFQLLRMAGRAEPIHRRISILVLFSETFFLFQIVTCGSKPSEWPPCPNQKKRTWKEIGRSQIERRLNIIQLTDRLIRYKVRYIYKRLQKSPGMRLAS